MSSNYISSPDLTPGSNIQIAILRFQFRCITDTPNNHVKAELQNYFSHNYFQYHYHILVNGMIMCLVCHVTSLEVILHSWLPWNSYIQFITKIQWIPLLYILQRNPLLIMNFYYHHNSKHNSLGLNCNSPSTLSASTYGHWNLWFSWCRLD